MNIFRRPFKLVDQSTISINLPEQVQDLLLSLVGQLRELLLVDDGDEIRRLYPTAYPDDDEHEEEYRSMVHDQLLMARLDAIETVEATVAAETMSLEQADQWMTTINEVRLVLGTKLDVGENVVPDIDPDDPDAASHAIYQVLTNVLGTLIDVRAMQL